MIEMTRVRERLESFFRHIFEVYKLLILKRNEIPKRTLCRVDRTFIVHGNIFEQRDIGVSVTDLIG
jgi:hypothetical protein